MTDGLGFRGVCRAAISSLVLAFLLGAAIGHAQPNLLNRPAPDFSRTDLQGARIDLAEFRGKVVLLDFWATWCAPCRLEMPTLAQWQKQYGPRGLRVLGVSIDDSEAPVRQLVDKIHLDYPVVMGNARLASLYGIEGVPDIFLIDRHGIVRGRFAGDPDTGALESEVRKLLVAH
jgi:thiol-disulfide isomerase/thioredoxin